MAQDKGKEAPGSKRSTLEGVVVSDKMAKTITVVVERTEMHRRYKKFIRRKTKLKARDANNEARVGDLVRIVETRPLAKTVNWQLVRVVRGAE